MKNKKLIITIVSAVVLITTLILLNLDTFSYGINRIKEVFSSPTIKTIFDIYIELNEGVVDDFIGSVEDATNNLFSMFESWDTFLENMLLGLTKLLTYISLGFLFLVNVGFNFIIIGYIFAKESINKTNLKIKHTPAVKLIFKINQLCRIVFKFIKTILIKVKNFLYKQRKLIALSLLSILIGNGYLFNILVEVFIFLLAYIFYSLTYNTTQVLFPLIQSLIIFLYPKLHYAKYLLPLLPILIFMKAKNDAEKKLNKNHMQLKSIAQNQLTQTTFINGLPGTGKTLLNVSLSLATEENYIEFLEQKLRDYEYKHKEVNFAEVRNFPDLFPEHQEYLQIQDLYKGRGTLLISNYSIYSPIYEEYSKIFNFDYLRKNKETDKYPLEEFIVISLSEFDKEYNSHDDKKLVGEDGAATFFSTVSHDLKRNTKIFVDYQLKDQVPLRIRGNAENFVTIKKNKLSYPLLLNLYYKPIKKYYNFINKKVIAYETNKGFVTRKSKRMNIAEYKRNDYTLVYSFLRTAAYHLDEIITWFKRYEYFRLKTIVSTEDNVLSGYKETFRINITDLSHKNQKIYDSTYLSYAYQQKKNTNFKDLPSFTKLSPTIEELDKCNSKFYQKINQNINTENNKN
ncbi:MAG: hypothetical protein R3Y05_02630 [bacterium]